MLIFRNIFNPEFFEKSLSLIENTDNIVIEKESPLSFSLDYIKNSLSSQDLTLKTFINLHNKIIPFKSFDYCIDKSLKSNEYFNNVFKSSENFFMDQDFKAVFFTEFQNTGKLLVSKDGNFIFNSVEFPNSNLIEDSNSTCSYSVLYDNCEYHLKS